MLFVVAVWWIAAFVCAVDICNQSINQDYVTVEQA